MKRYPCSYDFTCPHEGKYALYELRADLTKVWRADLCDKHENLIATRNNELKSVHDLREFKEA